MTGTVASGAEGPEMSLAKDGGTELMHHLLTDYLLKGAIVVGLAIVVLIAMVIIWKKVGTRK